MKHVRVEPNYLVGIRSDEHKTYANIVDDDSRDSESSREYGKNWEMPLWAQR